MIESLENLIALQKMDVEISRLKTSALKIEQDISNMEKSAVESQKEYDLLLQEIEEDQKERRQKERELEVKESELKKYKGQLFQVKTNREYEAMLDEIAAKETDIGLLEEDIIRLMEAGDDLKGRSLEKKKYVEKEKRELENFVASQRNELAGIMEGVKNKENERPKIEGKMEQNLVQEYNKLLHSHNDFAIVTAKNGICSGCFISMRPQMFEELKHNDRLFYCPNCRRFLYWDHNR